MSKVYTKSGVSSDTNPANQKSSLPLPTRDRSPSIISLGDKAPPSKTYKSFNTAPHSATFRLPRNTQRDKSKMDEISVSMSMNDDQFESPRSNSAGPSRTNSFSPAKPLQTKQETKLTVPPATKPKPRSASTDRKARPRPDQISKPSQMGVQRKTYYQNNEPIDEEPVKLPNKTAALSQSQPPLPKSETFESKKPSVPVSSMRESSPKPNQTGRNSTNQMKHRDPNDQLELMTEPQAHNDEAMPNRSKWLDENLQSLHRPRDLEGISHVNAYTDTFELDLQQEKDIRQLYEKIEDLECENKLKDRELDTNKWIEKEMSRKLKTQENVNLLKEQIKEYERQIDMIENLKRDIVNENNRLQDAYKDKEREVKILQSEVTNLDKILQKKESAHDEDDVNRLVEERDHLQEQASKYRKDKVSAEEHIRQLENKIDSLEDEVFAKTSELNVAKQKSDELKETISELEKRILKECEKQDVLKEKVNSLECQLDKEEYLKKEIDKALKENNTLKKHVSDLEKDKELLGSNLKEQKKADILAYELQEVVDEKNQIEKERQLAVKKLNLTESLLKDQAAEEEAIQREIAQLKVYTKELEQENSQLDSLEADYNSQRQKYDALRADNNYLEQLITQNSNQIRHLQGKCDEKDDCIRRLVYELKAYTDYLPSVALGRDEEIQPIKKGEIYSEPFHKPFGDHNENNPDWRVRSPPTKEVSKEFNKSYDPNRNPQPPIAFHLSMVLSENSVMVEWTPPYMDEMNRNNGFELIGYQLYLDGKMIYRVDSPHLTKAILHPINLSERSHLAIRSCSLSGHYSEYVELMIPQEEQEPGRNIGRWKDPSYNPENRTGFVLDNPISKMKSRPDHFDEDLEAHREDEDYRPMKFEQQVLPDEEDNGSDKLLAFELRSEPI